MKYIQGFEKQVICNVKPIINARSETAFEKPMFRESMITRRCLIPASGYYEWLKGDKPKTKYRFFLPDKPLYLAGCYHYERDSQTAKFVILTREAVNGLERFHDRMPVIIPYNRIEEWLNGSQDIMKEAVTDLRFVKAS